MVKKFKLWKESGIFNKAIREGGFSSTHNIKQLGFSGLRGFGSRASFFLGGYRTQPENPTVSYCQTLCVMQRAPID